MRPGRRVAASTGVFLKRLAIKGFKSFADQAVFDVEPGVTVVVGPNVCNSNTAVAMFAIGGFHCGIFRSSFSSGRRAAAA